MHKKKTLYTQILYRNLITLYCGFNFLYYEILYVNLLSFCHQLPFMRVKCFSYLHYNNYKIIKDILLFIEL